MSARRSGCVSSSTWPTCASRRPCRDGWREPLSMNAAVRCGGHSGSCPWTRRPTARCNTPRSQISTLTSCGPSSAKALRDGLRELPARDQWLLQLRAADPPTSYHEISQLTGMRIGSIGPTLRRSLDRLRETSSVRAYLASAPISDGVTGGDRLELADVE